MKFCSEELWESLAREDDTATFFQTPAWHRIAARHFKAESAPLLFDFAESQGGPACLPLLRDKRWGRWRYFSPFGTYTAVVCPRALEPNEIAVIEDALKGLNIQLASSPFTRNPVQVGKAIPARVQVLDLAGKKASGVGHGLRSAKASRFAAPNRNRIGTPITGSTNSRLPVGDRGQPQATPHPSSRTSGTCRVKMLTEPYGWLKRMV
jgi:hypothetical protein